MPSLRRAGRASSVAALAILASTVQADEVSGTWTGEFELRGNYFYEPSTRVMAPYARVRLDAPDGTQISADYLLDAVTSASIAQTGSDEDRAFTEIRHGVGLGVAKEFDVGGLPLQLSGTARYSTEPDYIARSARVQADLWLDQRATALTMAGAVVRDLVFSNNDPDRREPLNVLAWTLGWSQLVSPLMTMSLGYDLYYFEGFLANIYRFAPTTSIPQPEIHPSTRWRHALYGRMAHAIPLTDSAIHVLYRFYTDGWDVHSHAPEVRWYQMLGPSWLVRLRYRYYTQTAAFFHEPRYQQPIMTPYITGDPKMSAFQLHWVGLKLQRNLRLFANTPLDFLSGGTADVIVEHYWNTNRFGNAWHVQGGIRLPF